MRDAVRRPSSGGGMRRNRTMLRHGKGLSSGLERRSPGAWPPPPARAEFRKGLNGERPGAENWQDPDWPYDARPEALGSRDHAEHRRRRRKLSTVPVTRKQGATIRFRADRPRSATSPPLSGPPAGEGFSLRGLQPPVFDNLNKPVASASAGSSPGTRRRPRRPQRPRGSRPHSARGANNAAYAAIPFRGRKHRSRRPPVPSCPLWPSSCPS